MSNYCPQQELPLVATLKLALAKGQTADISKLISYRWLDALLFFCCRLPARGHSFHGESGREKHSTAAETGGQRSAAVPASRATAAGSDV